MPSSSRPPCATSWPSVRSTWASIPTPSPAAWPTCWSCSTSAALADRAPYQLSEGQKKRVAIASVLVMNPDTLLFDEPTAALDPATQVWFLDLLDELSSAGKTLVVATHDVGTIERMADRRVLLGEDHRVASDH